MRAALRRIALVTLGPLLALDACGPPEARGGSAVSRAQIVFMAPTAGQPAPGAASGSGGWELNVMDLDTSGREQVTHNQEQEFLRLRPPARGGKQRPATAFWPWSE